MNNEVMVPTITLENEKEYIVLDTIVWNENKYIILTEENDPEAILINRVLENDILSPLDNALELKEILNMFLEKHPELKSQNMWFFLGSLHIVLLWEDDEMKSVIPFSKELDFSTKSYPLICG